MKFLSLLLIGFALSACNKSEEKEYITSSEQYVEYLKSENKFPQYTIPEKVIVIYSPTLLQNLLERYPQAISGVFFKKQFYILEEENVGLLLSGMGAPSLAHKMEQLITCGVKRFVAVGMAGSLVEDLNISDCVTCVSSLGEDGVAHLYKKGDAIANPDILSSWHLFLEKRGIFDFKDITSWSFPLLFRESKQDLKRVVFKGASTVEMESATLYAIGEEKGIEALALFVISDTLAGGEWHPQLKSEEVREKLFRTTLLAIEFLKSI